MSRTPISVTMVDAALSRVWELLDTHRAALDTLAERLCEQETVDGDEVAAILERHGVRRAAEPDPAQVILN